MKKFVLIAIACALGLLSQPARGEVSLGPNFATRSVSGQFIVHDLSFGGDDARLSALRKDPDQLRLVPSVLVVACERIKQLLWRRLDDRQSWRGKIFLNLRTPHSASDRVTVVSEKYSDGWQYRVDLPNTMDRDRFVRVVVQVLLLEIANRNSEVRSTEIPLWLVEGLAADLIATDGRQIVLSPPTFNGVSINDNEQRKNPLVRARQVLDANAPLTFDQLSWPADNQWTGGGGEIYRCSAQLFVNRLLRLRDGPACLRATLGELHTHFNWQVAFLAGFKPHFERVLDIEKWWAVQVAEFTGRELTQTWSVAESWFKLDQIVHAPAHVQTTKGQSPLRTEVKLQSFLRDANGIEQRQFYQQKLHELDALRVRVSPDLVGLVDEYRAALGAYLQRQNTTTPFVPLGKQGRLVANPSAEDLIHRLDALDARRLAMQPSTEKAQADNPQDYSSAFRP